MNANITSALERLNIRYRSLDDLFNDNPLWKWGTVTKQHCPDLEFVLTENENCYKLTLDLPGFKQNEVFLIINGEVASLTANRDRDGVKRELKTEMWLADISDYFDFKNVKAKLEDGVLTVTLPKLPEPENLKVRKIVVE